MFRLSTLLSTLTLLACSFFWLCYLGGKSDSFSPPKKRNTAATLSSSEQVRQGVCKDIWLAEATGQRLHHRIESDRSLITFHPKESSVEVLEHLFGVRCWIQEKNTSLKDPRQQIRFVLAEDGLYHYKHQSFRAQDVLLSMYKIPENYPFKSLESFSPFLRGTAESITFSLQNGSPKFEASKFKASLGEKPL